MMRKEKKIKIYLNWKVQQLVNNSKKSSFNKDLCSAMLSANILLYKLGETSNSLGQNIANVVIGTLETDGPGQTFLLNSEVLTKANHSTIAKLFDNSMYPIVFRRSALRQRPIVFKRLIVLQYLKTKHLIFHYRRNLLTRWWTWPCGKFSIYQVHFGFLPDTTTSLEAKNISLSYAINAVQNVNLKLSQVNGPIKKIVKEKMNDILKKNIGYQSLIRISNIVNGEKTSMDQLPENLSINYLIYFKYAPVNSVNVERSFSMFKVLLADNRQSFQF
ncbi:hypothetical protein QTP88_006377 [Uroleucon formosanum]